MASLERDSSIDIHIYLEGEELRSNNREEDYIRTTYKVFVDEQEDSECHLTE